MSDLKQAAQQVLDAWDSPLWKTGTTAAKIAALRAALEQQAEPWCMKANGCKTRCGNCPNFTQTEQQAEPVAVYGYCPDCGAKGVTRERRPNGDDKCTNGHTYPSSTATPVQPLLMNHNGAVRKVHGYPPAPPQQQAEPVAWVFAPNNELLWPREVEVTNPIEIDSYYPLYTTPPQRKPLTEDVVGFECRKHFWMHGTRFEDAYKAGFRDAEAAHHIQEAKS